MSIDIGITGLPQSGKTTVFNALTKGTADTVSHPTAGITPHIGITRVPEPRLNILTDMLKPKRVVPAEIKYIDIGASVKDLVKDETISSQLLTQLSMVDALISVIRAFTDEKIPHIKGSIDVDRDISTMELELAFSDLAIIERRLKRIEISLKGVKHPERQALLHEQEIACADACAREFPLTQRTNMGNFCCRARIICAYTSNGTWFLASLDCSTGEFKEIATTYTEIWNLRASPGQVVFCGGSPTQTPSIVRLNFKTSQFQTLRLASDLKVDEGYLSVPEVIEFPTEHQKTSHAFFYPPRNCDYQPPDGERPPLLVKIHGGPTAATSTALAWEIQYWTSRGFAMLDVNYGGSSGYGRTYRQRLEGQWGIVDVDDCANGARYLAEQGRVDGKRLAIRGSSAGGYTTLCALTFRNIFKAGASYYGISDLEALAKETHKFEARYLDRLVGPYPERQDIYRQRSPIHFTDLLSCPLILFQGLEDEVVPPNQAEMMVAALQAKGLTVAYVPFEGEQHGFRRAETIKRALDSELYFYSRVFGFELEEAVEAIEIHNL